MEVDKLSWCTHCLLWILCPLAMTMSYRILIKANGSRRTFERVRNAWPKCSSSISLSKTTTSRVDDNGWARRRSENGNGDVVDDEHAQRDLGKADKRSEETRCRSENEPMGRKTHQRLTLEGPWEFPLIGSLHLLGGSEGPFHAFTMLSRKYGDIYKIRLGTSRCVVVSSYPLVKEVLVTKGNHFGGRPDFLRFHELFGGDRNNSLALCDWSELQRTRRSLARSYCSPRNGSIQQDLLKDVASVETTRLMEIISSNDSAALRRGEQPLKPVLMAAVANMFTRYMCSTWFSYEDDEFRSVVRRFDEIFWEINQGYAIDFLPWLRPFYVRHMKRLRTWATDIRSFILKRIINERRATLDANSGIARDFTDALLLHLDSPDSGLTWEHVIFELEDFLGGHSAIGNLVMLVLAYVSTRPVVQEKIQAECDEVCRSRSWYGITLDDRARMPYTEAVIWETLRVSSSPIVPHVATIDTEISGYSIPKNTVVFVNNYELNLGETYWGPHSKSFRPERFLVCSNSVGEPCKLVKPAHFVPFSTGKRTCIGQRLVQSFAFATIASLLSRYQISPIKGDLKPESKLVPGSVAVHPDTFHLVLSERSTSLNSNLDDN